MVLFRDVGDVVEGDFALVFEFEEFGFSLLEVADFEG